MASSRGERTATERLRSKELELERKGAEWRETAQKVIEDEQLRGDQVSQGYVARYTQIYTSIYIYIDLYIYTHIYIYTNIYIQLYMHVILL